jgi:hypothetical protein
MSCLEERYLATSYAGHTDKRGVDTLLLSVSPATRTPQPLIPTLT